MWNFNYPSALCRYSGVLLLATLSSFCLPADRERITNFHSAISVHPDGSMLVTETIQVMSTGNQIKRGIVREFPTRYRDRFGTNYAVTFIVEQVLKDGKPEKYHTKNARNGKRVFIGERTTYIPRGLHEYTIVYTTNRQLGFFKDHDELFWNVTGNGWRLPIDKATFEVTLPTGINPSSIRTTAYTGYQDESGRDFTINVTPQGTIIGSTTRALQPNQGLTIAIAWPKGFVVEPTSYMIFYYFLRDNAPLLLLFLWLIFLIIIFLIVWRHNRLTIYPGTIIPRFEAPPGLSPADVACINAMKYENKALTAAIVDMAVRGLLIIEYVIPSTTLNNYVVHKQPHNKALSTLDTILMDAFFAKGDSCALNESNAATLTQAIQKFKAHLEKEVLQRYIDKHARLIGLICIVGVGLFLGTMIVCAFSREFDWVFDWIFDQWIPYVFIPCIVGATLWGAWLIKSYTKAGRIVQDQIEGFAMFLSTAEVERLKIIGSPPTKTPELYEKYLPYAIALGLEEQWSHQFDVVFARLQQEGHEYHPTWYRGPFRAGRVIDPVFLYSMRNLVPSTIASAASRPGSRSGFGSGGGAGGGGGGGGGGGW